MRVTDGKGPSQCEAPPGYYNQCQEENVRWIPEEDDRPYLKKVYEDRGVPNKPGDSVNHPKHYNMHPSGVECIEIVEHLPFNLGNAIKYLWRSSFKDKFVEDINKSIWYLKREVARLEDWIFRMKDSSVNKVDNGHEEFKITKTFRDRQLIHPLVPIMYLDDYKKRYYKILNDYMRTRKTISSPIYELLVELIKTGMHSPEQAMVNIENIERSLRKHA